MTDPIADFLTRLRNAQASGHSTCEVNASQMKERLAAILAEEGYIADWSVAGDGPARRIAIRLKYGPGGERVIRGLRRVSTPGRRVYRRVGDLPKVLNGLGISIISTSRGVVTDRAARQLGVGGEVLCNVW